MAIEPGQQLLHYRLIEQIGEGGMGVVWKAADTTLDREVAIKVLPQALAAEADRLTRFEREAKLLASLNHPNVAAVYGLHETEIASGPLRFIAMELVEGEDLSERLARGPLSPPEALGVAVQIAEGLSAAHEAGVIHRDLKPANVKLTPGHTVKVLDFGLAKAWGGDAAASEADPSRSPTMTSAGTVAGIILGTAAYMSPEQARGRPVDKRADIWAFGVVLFEMLTGGSAFRGDDIADTMASVLKLEPDFERLPPETPTGVRRVLRRCLQKDPERRLRDIADVRLELEEVDLDAPAESAPAQSTDGDHPTRSNSVRLVPLAAGTGLGLLLGALLIWFVLGEGGISTDGTTAEPVRRSSILLPSARPLHWANGIALSPDGSLLAITTGGDKPSIYLRRLDSLEWEAVPGTEGALGPFFSPNGESIGFIADDRLKKVSLRGGGREVTVLCDAQAGWRGTWDDGGWIYFTYGESRLARVRENGGDVEELGQVGDVHHLRALPDGKGILLSVHGTDKPSTRKDTAQIVVLSSEDLTVKPVLDGGYAARYLASGHLVFMRGGGLFAVPFDLERLEASPPAVSVLPNVWRDSIWAIALYDATPGGTLVYASGGDVARSVPTWVDLETGEEERVSIPPALYNTFDLSPDGTRLAIQDLSGSRDQVWIHDARRDTFTRLTLEGANSFPVWSHDGREVFFASNRDGEDRLFRRPVDGSAPASRLLTDEQEALMETDRRWPSSVTPDGKYLVIYTWGHPSRGGDLWKVPLDGSSGPELLLATPANEIIPEVSPDGNWLAYLSNEKGSYQIVVRPFADMQRREWVVSDGAGSDAIWSPRGDALLYWKGGTTQLIRTPVTSGDTFDVGASSELRIIEYHDASGPSLAISPDGRRVLVQKPVDASIAVDVPMTLVTGWAHDVTRMVEAR